MKKDKLMSPFAVFLLGINSIIGSGIFLLAPKIYQDAGVWSILAILLAGLSVWVISMSYANMARTYAENGGAFIYAKETFGPFAGYVVGMITWIAGTITLAGEVAALMVAAKMLYPNLSTQFLGLGLILLMGLLSYFGSSIISSLDNITSAVKILIVLVFIAGCVWLVKGSNFTPMTGLFSSGSGWRGFLAAYGTIFFFYTSFASLPINATKMQNPQKILPRMLTIVILTCTAVYVVIQAITVGALGASLPATAVPAAEAFSKIVGPIGVPIIVLAICISIFGVIVATSFNTPTILATLADQHEDVPMIVSKKNKFGTPVLALVFTTLGAMFIFSSGNYVFLSGLTVFMSFIQYVVTGLDNMRKKFIAVGTGTIFFSAVLLLSFTAQVLLVGVGIVIFLMLIYLLVREVAKYEMKAK